MIIINKNIDDFAIGFIFGQASCHLFMNPMMDTSTNAPTYLPAILISSMVPVLIPGMETIVDRIFEFNADHHQPVLQPWTTTANKMRIAGFMVGVTTYFAGIRITNLR